MPAPIRTRDALLGIVLAIVALVAAQLAAQLVYLLPLTPATAHALFGGAYVLVAGVLLVLPCRVVLHLSPADCRIGRPVLPARWLLAAILLPVGVSLALITLPGDWAYHPAAAGELAPKLTQALLATGLAVGAVEEMVFRGVILSALERRWNRWVAVLFPSMLFGLLHALGAELGLADIALLFVAGTSVGVMFSLITLESGSVWPAAVVHGLWNALMIGGILHIGPDTNPDALLSYRLSVSSPVLTGGSFGVESSLFAVIGYLVVSAAAVPGLLRRRRSSNT